METIYLGGGCFWCIEAVFSKVQGVSASVSGYMGGHLPNPDYESVCTERTGHVEVVKIDYDPHQITLNTLLEIFWTVHDPTTPDRQGNDKGPQYKSAVFYTTDQQKEVIYQSMKDVASALYDEKIVTYVAEAPVFYAAESYHQQYFDNHPGQAYCSVVISPKVRKLKKLFAHYLK